MHVYKRGAHWCPQIDKGYTQTYGRAQWGQIVLEVSFSRRGQIT